MYSIRVNSDLAALVHRTASYCGVEFGTIIRRAGRDKLCNTLPVIQVENSELYHAGKMEHFLTTRNHRVVAASKTLEWLEKEVEK